MLDQDTQNRKYITVSFLAFAIIMAIVVRVFFESGAVAFGFLGKLWADPKFQHGIPVTVGIATFFVLQFSPKIVVWADEVVFEIRKVVWPSKADTWGMTAVCCVMLILAGIFFGTFDLITTTAVREIMTAR